MNPSEYRKLANELRAADRDADADVCEILAQEAERLARLSVLTPMQDEPEEEDDPPVAVVMTPSGPQALLPTFAPPPVTIDAHTQQLTLI